jgi:hypothetical protein
MRQQSTARNSALTARTRLTRLKYEEWCRRLNLLLSVGGFRMTDFPQYDFESYYRAGAASGVVAVTILGAHGVKGEKDAVVVKDND